MEVELISIIDISSPSNMEHTSIAGRGGRLQALFLQALFPSTIFVLVMVMALEAATLAMLTITSSRHTPCRIGG